MVEVGEIISLKRKDEMSEWENGLRENERIK